MGETARAAPEPVDLLVAGRWVCTMDDERSIVVDGAVAVRGDRIVDVGRRAELEVRWSPASRLGGPDALVVPGFVNAHQHLTGDRLVRSTIPDSITSREAIFEWAVPLHEAHTGDDDELSATCALVEAAVNGITFAVEAGTVAHPDRVLAAYEQVGLGGTLGSWGSDAPGLPYAGDVAEVTARQRDVVELTEGHPSVRGWVTLVGHDLMSDELVVAASELARDAGTLLTFHLSPSGDDAVSYVARTGRRPAVHLAALGALGPHVLVAHAVHLDDAELDAMLATRTAIAACPWAYLRLAQGVTGAGRHAEFLERGGRLALGCDSENAGDAVDVLRAAALAAGLAKDTRRDPGRFGAHTALELATVTGAEAVGEGHERGSLQVGRRADLVVIDTTGPEWTPPSRDPVVNLVWASGSRSITDVVCGGRIVVRAGQCVTVDVDELRARAIAAGARLLARAHLDPRPLWPTV